MLFTMSSLIVINGCQKVENVKVPQTPVVEVIGVVQKDVPIYNEWVGVLDGSVNAVIRPQVTGYLVKQNYHEGELVHKGQILFQIDPRSFEAAVKLAKASVDQAKASLGSSKSFRGDRYG